MFMKQLLLFLECLWWSCSLTVVYMRLADVYIYGVLSNKWLMLVHICCIWKKILSRVLLFFSKMIFKWLLLFEIWRLLNLISKFIWKVESFLETLLMEFDSVVKLLEFRTILWIFEFKVGKILTCLKLKYLIWEFKLNFVVNCGFLTPTIWFWIGVNI